MDSKILFIFIIINLFLPIIICDECDDCTEPTTCSKCKQSLINGDSNYYYCNFDGSNQFYFINGQCYVKPTCDDNQKIVDGTNECVNSCGEYYELGDFCFGESQYSENAEPISTDSKQLKCKYKYYVTQVSGKKWFNCLGAEERCPDMYTSYNYDTGLCFIGSCDSLGENIRIKSENINGRSFYRCSIECIEGGTEYLKTRVDNLKIVYTCIDSCTSLKNDDTTIPKCYANEEECRSDGYLYIKGDICLKECSGFKVKSSADSQTSPLGICYDDLNSCITSGYPYYNIEKKECWVSCPGFINFNINTNQQISNDNSISNCVDSCTGNFPRISGNYCKAKCIKNEYYDSSLNLNECKNDCGDKYIKIDNNGEYICVEIADCPDSKYYINDSGKRQCMPEGGCQSEYKYFIEGDNQCYKECPQKADGKYYFYNDNNKCISSCIGNGKEFAEDPTNGPKPCLEGYSGKYYYEDKILRDSCELYKERDSHECVKQCENKVYDNYCINQCPPEASYFVDSTKSVLGEIKNIKKCVPNCKSESSDYKYILRYNNQCMQDCIGDYYIVGDFCYHKCTANKKYIDPQNIECKESCENYEKFGDLQNIYICISNCEEYYVLDSSSHKECYSECPNGKHFIGQNNECKGACSNDDGEYYELIKETPYKIYKCISSCNDSSKKFYIDKECIDGCPPNYHKDGNKCVLTCPPEKPYLNDNNECIVLCEDPKKYFIESQDPKKCLRDCTSSYPYYYETGSSPNIIYECKATCSIYVVNQDNNIIAKKCLEPDTECPETAKFRYEIGNKIECYSLCPNGKYYIDASKSYESDDNYKCLDECPSGFYHEKNQYKCVKPEDCSKKTADYDTKTCVSECHTNNRTEIKVSGELKATICLKNCNSIYKYLTPDNQCVENCAENSSLFLVNDSSEKCLCQKLYYYDDSNIMKCIDPSADTCQHTANNAPSYKISKDQSNECLKSCKGVLSVTERVCYDTPHICTEENSKLITLSNGQKKCECIYKYYFEGEDKKCLGQNDDCPAMKKYIPETNGCVDNCEAPYQYNFNNYCMRKCPDNSNQSENVCTCEHYWYSYSNFNFICLSVNECPKTHPFVIEATNQCVEKCTGTYDILHENKCVSTCTEANTSKTPIRSFESNSKYTNYICQCNYEWYYDITQNKNICSNEEKECSEINSHFKYEVKETKQCVSSCPENDPFIFNSECLHDCNSYSSVNDYYIKSVSNSKVCECIGLWKYEDDEKKTIICINTGYCPYSSLDPYVEVVDTKECLKGDACPPDSPLKFNQRCYKMNSCPINSHYDSTIQGTCVCDNLWYKYTDANLIIGFIFCLPKNEENCPMDNPDGINNYPYQIFKTKECLKQGTNCPANSYIFNYICYENSCPYGTKENESPDSYYINYNLKDCICDKEYGYWYKYEDNESQRDYYKCSLEKCEGNFINLYIKDNECVVNCYERNGEEDNPMVSFRGVCYEECPDFTKPKIDFEYECGFYKLEEAENLEQLRNYVNIQVRELYQSSNVGGYLYNNSDISLQIYGLDKQNANKNLNMKSNLGYIDLDTCTDKIYKDNHLSDNDKILVIKYDMLNFKTKINEENDPPAADSPAGGTPAGGRRMSESENNIENNNYLITPVEYEFFSSVTGEKIDASICEPNEIIISYPISYTISKYDDFIEGMNKNELRKKFEVGKILSHQNSKIDVFNSNNSAYKTICTGVEINGKDLILEDRFDNLYPNNYTLCEPNCTFFSTDYELGRINCKCNYKKNPVFKREYPESGDLLNDPDFKNPTQSSSNLEVIKCLSKFPGKNSIIKNEAFYYCAVITVAEVSMIFVAAFHGLKGAISSVANLMKPSNIKTNIETKNINNNNNYIATSKRALNNPPKKNGINEDDDNESQKTGNIVNKKKIEIMGNKNPNNYSISETDKEDDIMNRKVGSYGIRKKNLGMITNNKNNLIESSNQDRTLNLNLKGKAEFMPMQYNFKYFKGNEKGIIKKIERSKLPFKLDPSTKYLLERKEDVNYEPDYLYGPFLASQNIIEIIDEEQVVKYDDNKVNINKNNNLVNGSQIKNNKKEREIRNVKNNKELNTESNFINVKKISPAKRKNDVDFIVEDFEEKKEKKKLRDNLGLYTLIKREQRMQRIPYNDYIEKDHSNLLSIFLAEIMDKIYLIKICCFLRSIDIFSVHIFLYLLYHLLLLTLLCAFFTTKTIKKIWDEENYPKMNFYLLYGFLGNVVIWLIYKIFICLLNNQDKVTQIQNLKKSMNRNETEENIYEDDVTEKDEEINDELIQKKCDELVKRIKITMIIFFVIGFLLTVFCFIYLVSFFAIYTGTKSKVLKLYYISLIEILLIKFVYGICLAALRISSEANEIEKLYKVVYICEKYVS